MDTSVHRKMQNGPTNEAGHESAMGDVTVNNGCPENEATIPGRKMADKETRNARLKRCILASLTVVVGALLTALSGSGSILMTEPVRYENGVVAADVRLCSQIGRNILKQGGHAVDATVSTFLCLGVVNAQSSGLGGGMFMVIYDKKRGKPEVLMARERAPSAAKPNITLETLGYKSVAVPGELQGLWEAHRRYGRLPWRDLFEPVIRLAEEGFPVTTHLSRALKYFTQKRLGMLNITLQPKYAWLVSKYGKSDGSWKSAGEMVTSPKLAKTLRAIAENGSRELYTGETGRRLIQEIQDNGGLITSSDLADYRATWTEALTFPIGQGISVAVPPSPSGGPVLQFLLNILKNFNISSADFKTTSTKIRTYHRLIEASKFAYAFRSYLGDVSTPLVEQTLANMASKELAASISSLIRDDSVTYTNASGYGALINTASHPGGTSHTSVVDQDGNAVSATSSINKYFGSGVLSDTTGILLNNQMTDFDTPDSQPASSANYVAPGKVSLSAMSPAILLNANKDVELVIGSAGSKSIIALNALCILRSMFTDVTLKELGDDVRIYNVLQPENVARYEAHFPQDIIHGLEERGHVVKSGAKRSALQAIRRQENGWMAYIETSIKWLMLPLVTDEGVCTGPSCLFEPVAELRQYALQAIRRQEHGWMAYTDIRKMTDAAAGY